jgi:C-terminal processing protease CtpA/Prc
MHEDWNEVLVEFLPKLEAAKDPLQYGLGIAEMLTHVYDSHSSAWSDTLKQKLYGEARAAVDVRFIENVPVVTGFRDPEAAERAGIALGDTILAIDGTDVSERIGFLPRYLSASTPQGLKAVIGAYLLNGPNATAIELKVRRVDGSLHSVKIPRKAEYRSTKPPPPAIVRLLPANIGYVNLVYLTVPMVDEMFESCEARAPSSLICVGTRAALRGPSLRVSPTRPKSSDRYTRNRLL